MLVSVLNSALARLPATEQNTSICRSMKGLLTPLRLRETLHWSTVHFLGFAKCTCTFRPLKSLKIPRKSHHYCLDVSECIILAIHCTSHNKQYNKYVILGELYCHCNLQKWLFYMVDWWSLQAGKKGTKHSRTCGGWSLFSCQSY